MRFDADGPVLLRWLAGTALAWAGQGMNLRVAGQVPVDVAIDRDTSAASGEQMFVEFHWPAVDVRH